jgi:hypothetical protein
MSLDHDPEGDARDRHGDHHPTHGETGPVQSHGIDLKGEAVGKRGSYFTGVA